MPAKDCSPTEMARLNLITALVLMALGLVAIFWLIPTQIEAKQGVRMGLSPRFFPYVSAISLLALSVLMAVINMVRLKRPANLMTEESEENEILGFGRREVIILVQMTAGVCVYMLLVKYTGFLVSSVAMLGVSMYLAGIRGWALFAVAVLFPWGVKLILWHTLEVFLP